MLLSVDHWSTRLQCRLGCDSKVNVVNASSEPLDDYFAEHYNFLQFAYHKRTLGANSSCLLTLLYLPLGAV